MYYDFLYDEEENIKYDTYYNTLKNIANIIIELEPNNIHEQFYIFCYLLWNGYFSINHEYAYNSQKPIDELTAVFLGSGCCRHNSQVLNDVIRLLDVYTKTLPIIVKRTNVKNIMRIDCKIEVCEKDKVEKNIENHQVTLVKSDNREWFILDPTMLSESEIIKNGKLFCLNGQYIVDKKNLVNNLNHANRFNYIYNKQSSIDRKLLIKYYQIARGKIYNNSNLIDDFYINNHQNYEKIKNIVLK